MQHFCDSALDSSGYFRLPTLNHLQTKNPDAANYERYGLSLAYCRGFASDMD